MLVVSRKNRNRVDSRDIIYDVLGHIGNSICKVITKKDSIRIEALRAINKWNGIDTNNIDSYLEDIVALHLVTNRMKDNLEYANNTVDIIPFLEKRYSGINVIIDCYNSYLESNPLVRIKYDELAHLDLEGVMSI